ncbi:pectinesterase inhibitor 9-like [Typha latifolia]|uniref:pectinesterase inhibitor 9-like n=1 Tax=Typha latifolia TaxID=4733 RepID=UPI003C2FE9AE
MTTSLAKDEGGVGRQAVADCEDCFEEAVGELRDSVEELTRLEEETFRWQMSNVEAWVSAALTNQVTCLDGLEGCKGRREVGVVRKKVVNATRATTNALDLINQLASSRGN